MKKKECWCVILLNNEEENVKGGVCIKPHPKAIRKLLTISEQWRYQVSEDHGVKISDVDDRELQWIVRLKSFDDLVSLMKDFNTYHLALLDCWSDPEIKFVLEG